MVKVTAVAFIRQLCGQVLRRTWRDIRAGELRLLAVALVLAVGVLSCVAFFADRIQAGLQRDAHQLLGGEVVVVSDHPVPLAFIQKAQSLGLAYSENIVFPSMARAPENLGGDTRLVSIKGVDETYPLMGNMQVQGHGMSHSSAALVHGPAAGVVWVDRSLLDSLNLQLGNDLWLGDARLRIDGIIEAEPDRGAGFMVFAPRVMVAIADLPATGLIQPASRVSYRLCVAAKDQQALSGASLSLAAIAFQRWVEGQIQTDNLRGMRLDTLETGRPEMSQTIGRAEKFLRLVALLSALLAAVALAMAAYDFSQRHLDECAILRVLGVSQRQMAWAYGLELALVGLFASLLGVALGFGLHFFFIRMLGSLLGGTIPATSWWPVGVGLGAGMVLVVGFALPPVLQLAQVPALHVIRRQVVGLRMASLGTWLLSGLSFTALLFFIANDWFLGLMVAGGFATALGIFALITAWFMWVLKRSLSRFAQCAFYAYIPSFLTLALRQWVARPRLAMLQVSAVSVGLMALLLLILLRIDLINSWRNASPPDAPNRFVINIQPDQSGAFQELLRQAGVVGYDWSPMVRGRLIAVNDRLVKAEQFTQDRAQRLVEREFNLSYMNTLPRHNVVVAGQWQVQEAGAISVEEGIAKTLNLKLGDRLQFDMAGYLHEGRITSIRKLDWASMRVNFFMIYPVAVMPNVPITFISAFQAPSDPKAATDLDRRLLREFPNVTNVDVSQTLSQVQNVLTQVIMAVEFLFVFALVAGLLVLLVSVSMTRQTRLRDYAVMRAIGASNRLLNRMQLTELWLMGALAGLQSSILALLLAWSLAHFVFEFEWNPVGWVVIAGTLISAALAWAAGWWGLRGVLQTPAIQTLRQG